MLKHVRPGNGFEPNFPLLEKCDVNGDKAAPLYRALRAALPYAHDRTPEMDMEQPYGIMKPQFFNPGAFTTPSDIHWNFEKFLLSARGEPRFRFSNKTSSRDLAPYIEELIKEASEAHLASPTSASDEATRKAVVDHDDGDKKRSRSS